MLSSISVVSSPSFSLSQTVHLTRHVISSVPQYASAAVSIIA